VLDVYADVSWLNVSFNSLSKFQMLAFQLSHQEALLRAKLEFAELQLKQLLFPTPAPIHRDIRPENELFYWWANTDAPEVQSISFQAVTSENLEQWHRWWRLGKMRFARLQEAVAFLGRKLKLLSHAIQLLLKALGRPLFAYQLLGREHPWCLLHGAHPPRQHAGIFRPAFAEPGRVRCEPAC
jgi:hypothetical protein